MKKYLEKKKERASPRLARHALPSSATLSQISSLEAIDHIKVGSFYEIDHSKLPSRAAIEQLNVIRIVMVSEMGPLKVGVRFPSINSLRTHITEKGYAKPLGKQIPALNEKYVMSPEMASEVLYRRVSPMEMADRSSIWSFWAARPAVRNPRWSASPSPAVSVGGGMSESVVSKKGPCWSELNLTEMLKWGKRRQVRYLRRCEPLTSSSSDDEETETGKELVELEESDDGDSFSEEEEDEKAITVIVDDDDDVEEEEDETAMAVARKMSLRNRKRKLHENNRKTTIKAKKIAQRQKKTESKAKRQKKNQIVAVPGPGGKQLAKLTVARWSAGRYKMAEENMLKVMKAKRAVIGNPILRPALRSEARKHIGDTGLLDHLLKHMAGKVAPGGADRFRRRHNADGAMEYWLENADLVNIRKEAGVQDSYWTPPPGWKPGDNPTQDPTCAREIKELREEIARIKMEIQGKKKDDGLAIVATSNTCLPSIDWESDCSLVILKEVYAEAAMKKGQLEEQIIEASQSLAGIKEFLAEQEKRKVKNEELVVEISQFLSELKERIGMLESITMEEAAPPLDESEYERANMSGKKKSEGAGDKVEGEDKAAKIQRLRSGFRICRPQTTFLWPDMGAMFSSPSQPVVPTPTPPSAFHLIPKLLPAQPRLGPTSPITPPVKPLAERRKGNISTNLSSVSTNPPASPPPPPPICPSLPPPPPPVSSDSQSTAVTISNTLNLNLNEPPAAANPNNPQNSCETGSAFSRPLTYQRRHHHHHHHNQTVTAKTAMARMEIMEAKEEEEEDVNARHDEPRWCSSSPSTASTWVRKKCWLSMGTSTLSLDD